jgi:hypothetical protein
VAWFQLKPICAAAVAIAAADHKVVAFDSAGGAKLLLYPGAGHTFLFQDAPSCPLSSGSCAA